MRRSLLWATVAVIASRAIGFVTLLVLTRLLAPDAFGTVAYGFFPMRTMEPEVAAKSAHEPILACMSPPGSHDSHCAIAA